jgi:hypothetical protein
MLRISILIFFQIINNEWTIVIKNFLHDLRKIIILK